MSSPTSAAARGVEKADWPRSVLFFASDTEDYLGDSVFHGLALVLGDRAVDFPKIEPLYASFPRALRPRLYGRGFSLYCRLPERDVLRTRIADRLAQGEFDLVVFGSVHRQTQELTRFRGLLSPSVRVALLDGEDTPALFPTARLIQADPRILAVGFGRGWLYFKREWNVRPLRCQERLGRLLPVSPPERAIRPIAFSIPEDVLVDESSLERPRERDFPVHIVDPEVAARVGGQTSYAFDDESVYHEHLSRCRFGITTKRAGWDCLRHYEIAARGAIPCFRDLDTKPATCAPHGLGPHNSISYRNADELFAKIARLSPDEEMRLRKGALAWARNNTTRARATELLEAMRPSAHR